MNQEDEDLVLVRVIGRSRFELGTVIVTDAVRAAVPPGMVEFLLDCHVCGDWGDGYVGRTSRNERALEWGHRLDSHYVDSEWEVLITTDPESEVTGKRASTTVYLFGEYSKVHGLE